MIGARSWDATGTGTLASTKRAPPCNTVATPAVLASRVSYAIAPSLFPYSPHHCLHLDPAKYGCFKFNRPRSSRYHCGRNIWRPPRAPSCHAGCERATTSASLHSLHQFGVRTVEKEEQILHRAQVGFLEEAALSVTVSNAACDLVLVTSNRTPQRPVQSTDLHSPSARSETVRHQRDVTHTIRAASAQSLSIPTPGGQTCHECVRIKQNGQRYPEHKRQW